MRVEEIMDAIVLKLIGLTTTGTNVVRGQIYDLSESQVPGLAIFMGEDILDEELSNSLYNWTVTIYIESKVSSPTTQVDQILNTIRGEVHAAIMADYTLGLPSFVINTNPVIAPEPDLSPNGSKPIGTQRLQYTVKYRTSRTDLSN